MYRVRVYLDGDYYDEFGYARVPVANDYLYICGECYRVDEVIMLSRVALRDDYGFSAKLNAVKVPERKWHV